MSFHLVILCDLPISEAKLEVPRICAKYYNLPQKLARDEPGIAAPLAGST